MQALFFLRALFIWAAAGSGVERGEQNPSSNAKSPAERSAAGSSFVQNTR
jgi:hypothetical protein